METPFYPIAAEYFIETPGTHYFDFGPQRSQSAVYQVVISAAVIKYPENRAALIDNGLCCLVYP